MFSKFINLYPEDALVSEAYSYRADITASKEATEDIPNPLDLAIIEAPSWLSLDEFILSGTPTSDDIGTYEISLSVSDGVDVVAQSFELVVDEYNDPPITSNLNFVIDEDQELEIILSATDEETPEDLFFNIVSQPENGTISVSRSLEFYTYVPSQDYNGTDSFDFSVSDGVSTVTGTVSIEINPVNDPPYFVTHILVYHQL